MLLTSTSLQEESRKKDGEKKNDDEVKILSVHIHAAQSG